MSTAPVAPPATFVIFGALGDLTRRLLMPAIVNVERSGLLDPNTGFLGISYHDADDDELRDQLGEFLEAGAEWQRLRERIHYLKGDFGDDALFETLAGRIAGNTVFYLATAPGFFGPIVESLGKAGLLNEAQGFRRVVIEKPFGTDLASAQALNGLILACAHEEQIYRIDHFLGKETVQNIMVARFGNALTEAVWNNRYIDHVQITAAETVAVGSRGKFYDATGALRDMVPNHLFQLLALVGMEPPNSFGAEAVRTEKAKLIAALRPLEPDDAVRGRYGAGEAGGQKVVPYRDTADVDPASRTETYVALKAAVETWRWHGVPFYLRTGKALAARDTEIVIKFRNAPLMLFHDTPTGVLPPNQLVLQIQPHEGICLQLAVKQPGPLVEAVPASLHFAYSEQFDLGHQTGYETLLYDVLIGDQTLFQRADQIEGGWRAVQPLLDAWSVSGEPEDYAAGSAGPVAAEALLARDGRAWHPIA
ncbi:glucose-6-phosphate dehydrogenase [Sphingomonas histidinilytica]|uniref:glucose-6-phosphate dehydrogenase n=1 Tax=Rhizorhabdus histidinilytica TaxID=439228 RepID=UPI001AD9C5CD|nr:glucose-6-phosphate dehydrogenase [Rhizorhabdus histidinilytica]MBO9378701.1 glucose-6-phosphate dehydrogenase [Rhizorhabdus histidinilytica]